MIPAVSIFLLVALGFPSGMTLPIDSEDGAGTIPILRPADSSSEGEEPAPPPSFVSADEEDQTDYPILEPQNQGEEFIVERPHPGQYDDEDDADTEQGSADKDAPVPRPYPEGADLEDEDVAALEYPGILRKRRDVAEDDDTVEIVAASCEDLERACADHDLIACQVHAENCGGNDENDAQINDIYDCVSGGSVNGKCPSLAASVQ